MRRASGNQFAAFVRDDGLKPFGSRLITCESALKRFESVFTSFESVLTSGESVLTSFESVLKFCESGLTSLESVFTFFESGLTFFEYVLKFFESFQEGLFHCQAAARIAPSTQQRDREPNTASLNPSTRVISWLRQRKPSTGS